MSTNSARAGFWRRFERVEHFKLLQSNQLRLGRRRVDSQVTRTRKGPFGVGSYESSLTDDVTYCPQRVDREGPGDVDLCESGRGGSLGASARVTDLHTNTFT